MSTSDATNESFGDKIKRMATNCGHATGLCCFKMGKQTQISALELRITQRQKKFGVDYLTLVDRSASQAALKDCLREAQQDIAALQEQIDAHFDGIDHKEAKASEKIVTATGASLASSNGLNNTGEGSSSVTDGRNKKRPSRNGTTPYGNDAASTDDDDDEDFASPSSIASAPTTTKKYIGNNGNKPAAKKPSSPKKKSTYSAGAGKKPVAASTAAGFAPANIPYEYQGADPSRWKMTEQKFGGATSFEKLGRKEPIIGTSIPKGREIFKANPDKYISMIYQSDVATWPPAQHQFTLVHRAGTEGYKPTGVSKNGKMTILMHHYERLPPLKDNILPAQYRDAYTDTMTHQRRKLHSKSNKPILPGRGMGVGDMPNLKIIGDVDPSDIFQGTVGDCWLLSGVSALAEFDGAVKRLFRKTTNLDQRPFDSPNQYIVSLWDLSTWKEVDITIDERLPVMANGSGRLLASRPSEDGELWACYLEKALAAHCGGWDKITGGQCTHAWALLTGCKEQYTISKNPKTGKFTCCAKYNPYEKKWARHANSPHDGEHTMWRVEWPKVGGGGSMNLELTEDDLFKKMVAWDQQNYIVGAGTSGTSDKNSTDGLVDNHAYSVIESRRNVCGTGIDLLKVRNPWGRGEIEDGEFDDDGPGWDRYPQIKKLLNPVVADDGIFWVTKDEFFQYYQTIYLSASDMTQFLED